MRGLQGSMSFTDMLTADQRRVAERLSEIEKEDADRCAHCGGEDCICCEYYLDRQKWQSPEEFFADYDNTDWQTRELMGEEYYEDDFEEDE